MPLSLHACGVVLPVGGPQFHPPQHRHNLFRRLPPLRHPRVLLCQFLLTSHWYKIPRAPQAWQPWENGYCELFNSKLREEFLNGEIFLLTVGSGGADRAMAGALQHTTTAFVLGLPPAGASCDRTTHSG